MWRSIVRARCHYDILGVPRTSTAEQIKFAFREKAKASHPDSADKVDTKRFRELVDAFRVLRDPKKRAIYDREWKSHAQAHTNVRTEAHDMHETATAAMYGRNYQYGQGQGGSFDDKVSGGMFAVFFGCIAFFTMNSATAPAHLPSRKPSGSSTSASVSPSGDGGDVVSLGVVSASDNGVKSDELVPAFFDPYFNSWHRIPKGYDAPGAGDLTAWHKKRTLGHFGERSQFFPSPAGVLKVRYMRARETSEPVLIADKETGKTILAQNRVPQKQDSPPGQTCCVSF